MAAPERKAPPLGYGILADIMRLPASRPQTPCIQPCTGRNRSGAMAAQVFLHESSGIQVAVDAADAHLGADGADGLQGHAHSDQDGRSREGHRRVQLGGQNRGNSSQNRQEQRGEQVQAVHSGLEEAADVLAALSRGSPRPAW